MRDVMIGFNNRSGPVAQLGARFHGMEEVKGSNPFRSTRYPVFMSDTPARDNFPAYVEIGDSVIYQTLEGEIVLLNMANQQYYGLDNVGADVWRLLLEHRSTAAVENEMRKVYAVDAVSVRRDLQILVRELLGAGLLKAAQP
jgi:hypothetical protein